MKKLGAFIIITIFIVNMFLPFQYVSANNEKSQTDENEPTILYEDETKRSAYEKHFVCSDGSYIAATYPEQVCYLNEEGVWQEIDNSLNKINGRYENKNSDIKVSFAEKANDSKIIELSNGKHNLAWNLDFSQINDLYSLKEKVLNMFYTKKINYKKINETTKNDTIVANNIESHVTYENLYSNTVDVQYTVLPGRIKENIILNEKTYLPSYNMNISCEGLTAKIDEENSVEFYDANSELQYEIQTPYMFDDIYELSYDIEIELQETDSGYMITFYPNQEWLNSDERVYPITIDPTVKTGTNKVNFSDTYIYQGSTASSSRALEERLRVGIYNDKKYRVFWKTSVLPTLPSNAYITTASFFLKFPDATTTSRNFSIYKVESAWESSTITWSQSANLSYSRLQSNISRNTNSQAITFNVTTAVKSWYNDGDDNNGFMIRYTDEDFTNPDYNLLYSSDNTTSTSYMPYLSISYATNKTSYSVGTDYGSGNIDTTEDATDANNAYSEMGLTYSALNTMPTVSNMKNTHSNNIPYLSSGIVFFSGHGNSQLMSFNYDNSGGNYEVIVQANTTTTGSYIGIGNYITPSSALIIFAGCSTAEGDSNISKYVVNKGAKASIGWSTSIAEGSHRNWLERFNNSIKDKNTSVSAAAISASNHIYLDSRVKNYVIYGDAEHNPWYYMNGGASLTMTSILDTASRIVETFESTGNNNMKNANLKKEADAIIAPTVETIIKNNFGKDLKSDNYIIEINGTEEKYIDLIFCIDNVRTNVGYTISIDKSGKINYYDNMNGHSINEITNQIKMSKSAISNQKCKTASENALLLVKNKYPNSKANICMSTPYYDVNEKVLYQATLVDVKFDNDTSSTVEMYTRLN